MNKIEIVVRNALKKEPLITNLFYDDMQNVIRFCYGKNDCSVEINFEEMSYDVGILSKHSK